MKSTLRADLIALLEETSTLLSQYGDVEGDKPNAALVQHQHLGEMIDRLKEIGEMAENYEAERRRDLREDLVSQIIGPLSASIIGPIVMAVAEGRSDEAITHSKIIAVCASTVGLSITLADHLIDRLEAEDKASSPTP